MAFSDDARDAVDAAFGEFGRAATFAALLTATPETFAVPVAVTVLPTTRDRELGGFAATSLMTAEAMFELRKSEVALPKRGDRLIVDAVDYRIAADPQRRDRFGLTWIIGTRKQQ